jgi:hypothetical protein
MGANVADIRCPMCGKPNPKELAECRYCGARIKPLLGSAPVEPPPLKPGDEPVKKNTSDLERINFGEKGSIRPGEVPTKKNTAELEKALPSWLRSLREEKRPAAGESLAEPSFDEEPPAAARGTSKADSSGGLPDWFSNPGGAASEDEEVPNWLAGLRGDRTNEPTPAAAEEESVPELGNEDWMTRLQTGSMDAASEPPAINEAPVPELPSSVSSPETGLADNSPDWMQALQSPKSDTQEPPAALPGGANLPEWLTGLQNSSAESGSGLGGTEESAPMAETPDWLGQLNQRSITPEPGAPAGGAESLPDWLANFESVPPAPAPETPSPTPAPEADTSAMEAESLPGWLSNFESTPAAPAPELPALPSGENLPDWLSNLEAKTGSEPGMPAAFLGGEPATAGGPPVEKTDWLSQLQAEANAAEKTGKPGDDFGAAPELPAPLAGSEPLPDWLAGIEKTPTPSGSVPALIGDDNEIPLSGEDRSAFTMETPEWLSKLKPESGREKVVESKPDQADAGGLEAAQLPNWVKAMRPVESVVETKTAVLDESQVTEKSGPLAGLRGVLPAVPGLSSQHKPPAYSNKLLISDEQQRYAKVLDRLVAGETQPRTVKATLLTSNQVWRWLITLLLILAVGLPIVSGAKVVPYSVLPASDNDATSRIIEGLTANKPVLVAFDYDPALSGELEAVAAPIMDQVLAKGIPLALISTSPTGPALAEHFLHTTSLVNVHQYQSGVQYLNLGYLAGGPAGMRYFAESPTVAMPVGVDGTLAWREGPLQGIQSLENFSAVIILTDNADNGRNWIEQAGVRLGNVPMLMIISAQAEPMIRPYFDSGQLKGLVSGLSDAKVLEQKYNRPGLANQYWDSYSIGMLVAELLIAAGAVLGFLLDWRARQKDTRKGA